MVEFSLWDILRNVMLAPRLVKQTDVAAATALAQKLLARVGLAEKFEALARPRDGPAGRADW